MIVLVIAAALWAVGAIMGAPYRPRLVMIGVLWLGVVSAHLVLPEGHGLRMATGQTAAPWLLLAGAVGVVLAYRAGLVWLRGRAAGPGGVPGAGPGDGGEAAGGFSETELGRYARHIMLREIGGPGQARLKQARVLVIGAGGLGSPVLLYLAAAGVGTIGVIDDDVVDGSNLQRQVIHTDAGIGQPKVFSAQAQMAAVNPFIVLRPYHRRLAAAIAADLFAEYDVIVDGSDNFDTREMVNAAAHAVGKPLVWGALTQWEGQVTVFDTARATPCYACVFPQRPAPGLVPSCAEAGVFAPLPGIIGTMMAAETIKLITGAGEALRGTLVIHDALHAETRRIALKPRPGCPVCAQTRKGHPDERLA